MKKFMDALSHVFGRATSEDKALYEAAETALATEIMRLIGKLGYGPDEEEAHGGLSMYTCRLLAAHSIQSVSGIDSSLNSPEALLGKKTAALNLLDIITADPGMTLSGFEELVADISIRQDRIRPAKGDRTRREIYDPH